MPHSKLKNDAKAPSDPNSPISPSLLPPPIRAPARLEPARRTPSKMEGKGKDRRPRGRPRIAFPSDGPRPPVETGQADQYGTNKASLKSLDDDAKRELRRAKIRELSAKYRNRRREADNDLYAKVLQYKAKWEQLVAGVKKLCVEAQKLSGELSKHVVCDPFILTHLAAHAQRLALHELAVAHVIARFTTSSEGCEQVDGPNF